MNGNYTTGSDHSMNSMGSIDNRNAKFKDNINARFQGVLSKNSSRITAHY